MAYSGEHLFKMVVAFEFLSFGLPAKFVTELVERHWDAFASAFSLAALVEISMQQGRKICARVDLRSFAEIQFWNLGTRSNTQVTICDAEHLQKMIGLQKSVSGFIAALMITDIYRETERVAREVAGVRFSPWDREVLAWLPKEGSIQLLFDGPYPDRSNLKVRKKIHAFTGNDPDWQTPDAAEEAQDFYERYLNPDTELF